MLKSVGTAVKEVVAEIDGVRAAMTVIGVMAVMGVTAVTGVTAATGVTAVTGVMEKAATKGGNTKGGILGKMAEEGPCVAAAELFVVPNRKVRNNHGLTLNWRSDVDRVDWLSWFR